MCNGGSDSCGEDLQAVRNKQAEYILKELEWYAERVRAQIQSSAQAPIEITTEGTRRSDDLTSSELRSRSLECIRKLEDVPEHLKGWRPGYKRIRDTIDPSMYPFVANWTFSLQG
jgi:hypothetical protein